MPDTVHIFVGLLLAAAEGLKEERDWILKLRNQDVISDEFFASHPGDIDLAEARLRRRH